MMNLTNIEAGQGGKCFTANFVDGDQARWDVELKTNDMPAFFENTHPDNRQVKLNIVSGNDLKLSDYPNSFLIPVVLSGMSHTDDKTISYYRSKLDQQDNSVMSAKINAAITADGEQSLIENPHLLIEFSVNKQGSSSSASGTQANFAGNDSQEAKEPGYVIQHAGASNGGHDIPLSQATDEERSSGRVVMTGTG